MFSLLYHYVSTVGTLGKSSRLWARVNIVYIVCYISICWSSGQEFRDSGQESIFVALISKFHILLTEILLDYLVYFQFGLCFHLHHLSANSEFGVFFQLGPLGTRVPSGKLP